MAKKVKIAAVEAHSVMNNESHIKQNVECAVKYIYEAAKGGADIVCFPETYPGPRRLKDINYNVEGDLSVAAKEAGIYVVYGGCHEAAETGRQYVSEVLLGPDGKRIGIYHRTCPPGPWIYNDPKGTFWDVEYIQEDNIPVFETDIGKIGLLVCSEVYVPELSRILAIKGAEITFLPAGLPKETLYDTWKLLLRARAIENLMYTVSCDNAPDDRPFRGMAIVAGPEGELYHSEKEGILYGEADLERLRWLRKATDTVESKFEGIPYSTKPNLIDFWRRPNVFDEITKLQK